MCVSNPDSADHVETRRNLQIPQDISRWTRNFDGEVVAGGHHHGGPFDNTLEWRCFFFFGRHLLIADHRKTHFS